MEKTTSLNELLIYWCVKSFAGFIRLLPVNVALRIGRAIGTIAYYFDLRHRAMAYANLKIAFANKKSPAEIRRITRQIFKNYGQNLIELLRLPLLRAETCQEIVEIEGKEHLHEALQQGKGLMLVAMHFGSWELASLACCALGRYKLVAKPQIRMAKLDELLNSYRARAGSETLARGMGTRDIIRSLHQNEMIGIVVDQGGKEGVLVPFFGRKASMSVGAIKLGLKMGVPLCFCVIFRQKGPHHKMKIYPPLELINTGDIDEDVVANLNQIVTKMEYFIEQYPAEYMWFYKIWKYSTESTTLILDDGRTGHLRQSQALAQAVAKALGERGIASEIKTVSVNFKNVLSARLVSGIGVLANRFLCQGRLDFLKGFLSEHCYNELMAFKAEFIISCGSSLASLNYLLTMDHKAKNIAILTPGILDFRKFDLVVLPKHDLWRAQKFPGRVIYTRIAPNLMNPDYLNEQSDLLLKRYSHLKQRSRLKIGFLLGGDTRELALSEAVVKMVINQIKEAAQELNADILATTSRRTSSRIENLVIRELKRFPRCQVLIIANRNNIPEAVGGILALTDVLVVSGDSISMISEAVSARKNPIIFPLQNRNGGLSAKDKYARFAGILNDEGYALSVPTSEVARFIRDIARNKIRMKTINEEELLLNEVRKII